MNLRCIKGRTDRTLSLFRSGRLGSKCINVSGLSKWLGTQVTIFLGGVDVERERF